MGTDPTELAKGNGVGLVEDMIFPPREVSRAFQLLKRTWSKAYDQLKLVIAGQLEILALNVEQFFDKLKGIPQFLSMFAIY